MTVTIEYEAQKRLELPFEEIIRQVAGESLDYVKCPYEAEVNVLLTDNEGIHQINLDTRGIDAPTDVLSFPMCDFSVPGDFSHLEECPEEYFNPDTGELMLGDIVISMDHVRAQAQEYGHSERRECGYLLTHGLFHLMGYDHMTEEDKPVMRAMEERTLASVGLTREEESE